MRIALLDSADAEVKIVLIVVPPVVPLPVVCSWFSISGKHCVVFDCTEAATKAEVQLPPDSVWQIISTHRRHITAVVQPIDDVDARVKLVAAWTEPKMAVPLLVVCDRKFTSTGLEDDGFEPLTPTTAKVS